MQRLQGGRPLATLTLVFALVALTGCGDSGGSAPDPQAQPAPDVSVFTQGDFGEIPVIPDSTPASEQTAQDGARNGAVAQSFIVADVLPREVVEFYERQLGEQWGLISGPDKIGPESWKAEWEFRDRRLRVTATPDPTGEEFVQGQQDVVTQYSLRLRAE